MKTISKLTIFFVLLFSATMAYSQCETYLQRAEMLFAEKKYDDAQRQYLNYKECKPNAPGIDEMIEKCEQLLMQCEAYKQNADALFAQKKYDDAKRQYLNYKECKQNAPGIDDKIAECDRLLQENSQRSSDTQKTNNNNTQNTVTRQPEKIYIGIRPFTGDRSKTGIVETNTINAFTSDGRFIISKVDDNNRSGNDQSPLDYIVSGNNVTITQREHTQNVTFGKQSIPVHHPEIVSVAFRISDAKTGQIYVEQTVNTNNISGFISRVFPVRCSIKSISKKDVEMVTVGGGRVSKGEVFSVYEVQNDGGYTRKRKIGELKITGFEGAFIKCQFKSGAKEITAKFRSEANLLVEK